MLLFWLKLCSFENTVHSIFISNTFRRRWGGGGGGGGGGVIETGDVFEREGLCSRPSRVQNFDHACKYN